MTDILYGIKFGTRARHAILRAVGATPTKANNWTFQPIPDDGLSCLTINRLRNVRGCGKKTREEIINVLKQHGIVIPEGDKDPLPFCRTKWCGGI